MNSEQQEYKGSGSPHQYSTKGYDQEEEEDIEMQTTAQQHRDEGKWEDNMSASNQEENTWISSSDPFSEELLQIGTRGLCGMLERIPLVTKLVFMIGVSLAGLIALAIFLITVEGQNISLAKTEITFNNMASLVDRTMATVQNERDACNTYLLGNSDIAPLEKSFQETNDMLKRAEKSFRDYEHDSIMKYSVKEYFTLRPELYTWRQMCSNKNVTTMDSLISYYLLLDAFWNVLGQFNFKFGEAAISRNYLMMIKVYEMQQQIYLLGSNAFARGKLTADEVQYLAYFMGNRDFALQTFRWHSEESVHQYYLKNVKIPSTQADAMEQYLILARNFSLYSDPLSEYSNDQWLAAANTKMTCLKQMMSYLSDLVLERTRQDVDKATGLIVGAIIVVLVFFFAILFSSTCSALTIVGPWRRMNKIQEMAINKFVPQQFLRLIGCKKITEAELGKYVEQKDMTIIHADIRHFEKVVSEFEPTQVFEYTNSYFNYIGPLIRKHHGFIHQYNGDGFVALFKNAKRGLRACVDIQTATDTFNKNTVSKLPPVVLGIGVQSGSMLVGTVGENERINGTIISHHAKISRLLEALTKKFSVNTLTTDLALENSGKNLSIANIKFRTLGLIQAEITGSSKQQMRVFEVLRSDQKLKLDNKDLFDNALSSFQQGLYPESISEFELVLRNIPDDVVSQLYLAKARELLNQVKYIISTLSVMNILVDDALFRGFEQFCQKEFSAENVSLYREIENFKKVEPGERREVARKLRSEYLSLNGQYTVNINQKLKDDIATSILDDQHEIDERLFVPIQLELELLMADTCKRFKESPSFYLHLNKSKYAPQKPFLDQL